MTLFGLGLVQVYSSSFILALDTRNHPTFFFERQVVFTFVGLAILFAILRTPTTWIKRWGWSLWIIGAIMVVATMIPGISHKAGGAARWLSLPFGLHFEPAELLKISFPLWIAFLVKNPHKLKWWGLALLTFVPPLLLLAQPDFGSCVILTLIALGLLFAFGLRARVFGLLSLLAIPAFYFLVIRVPYRHERLMAFINPWADPEGNGFQVLQSLTAFQEGGFWGRGLGLATSKLHFLPEAHTDFTLAVWGEETGFIGVLLLLTLFLFVIFQAFKVAFDAKDDESRIVSLGLALGFSAQVLINIGVALAVLPTKGLTLPFMSYGGSSILCLAIAFAVLLNLDQRHEF